MIAALLTYLSAAGDGGISLPEIGGIGVGATVLVLLVRTFWRQDSRWDDVLDAERQAAVNARSDAATAREEATLARMEASDLRRELVLTRERESSLIARVAALEEQIKLVTTERR